MTAKRRLVPTAEVRQHIELLRSMGIQIGAVDIRADGVTVYPPNQRAENDVDKWFREDADRDRPAHN